MYGSDHQLESTTGTNSKDVAFGAGLARGIYKRVFFTELTVEFDTPCSTYDDTKIAWTKVRNV